MSQELLREWIGQALLASRGDAIVFTDLDGIVRFWSPGASRMFGFSPEEAVGASLDLIIPERLRERHWEGYRRVMRTGVSRYGEGELLSVPAQRKDGERVSVEFTITLVEPDGGPPQGALAVLRDVTERFEELRALRRKIGRET
jgi:PAS domain S-box-containing protein